MKNDSLRDRPCFHKYVLLRVIKIDKYPVSQLEPTEYYDETMLVGLYGWIGDEIPDPKIVENLEYMLLEDSEPQDNISKDMSLLEILPTGLKNKIEKGMASLFSGRRETCAQLDWLPLKDCKKIITYLGCDESYEKALPEFFVRI